MSSDAPTPATLASRAAAPTAGVAGQRHRRGEIWMVTADPATPAVGNEIWSNRPAVIVSNNVLNARSGVAQVVYLSTAVRKRTGPTHVELPAFDGNGTTMALCEQIHTVDASRLRKRMAAVPADRIRDIDAALSLSLSIGRNPDTHSAFRKWEDHIKVHGIDIRKEIDALAGQTVDQRIDALTRALQLMSVERDAYRNLYESLPARESAIDEVAHALGANVPA